MVPELQLTPNAPEAVNTCFCQRPLNFLLVSFLSSLPSLPCSSCFPPACLAAAAPLALSQVCSAAQGGGHQCSTWCWLPQGCLEVEALQELLSWGLPTSAMLGSCHSHSAFVATCNLHCPKQGPRTSREAARNPSTSAHTAQAVE